MNTPALPPWTRTGWGLTATPGLITLSEHVRGGAGAPTTIVLPAEFVDGAWWKPVSLTFWPRGVAGHPSGAQAAPIHIVQVRIAGVQQMPAPLYVDATYAHEELPVAWDWIASDRQLELDVLPVGCGVWFSCDIECACVERPDDPNREPEEP